MPEHTITKIQLASGQVIPGELLPYCEVQQIGDDYFLQILIPLTNVRQIDGHAPFHSPLEDS